MKTHRSPTTELGCDINNIQLVGADDPPTLGERQIKRPLYLAAQLARSVFIRGKRLPHGSHRMSGADPIVKLVRQGPARATGLAQSWAADPLPVALCKKWSPLTETVERGPGFAVRVADPEVGARMGSSRFGRCGALVKKTSLGRTEGVRIF